MSKKTLDDDDAPELTTELLKRAVPLKQVLPELYSSLKRERGRPRIQNPKVNATIRLDPEVLAAYKATGRGWQTKINAVLRDSLPIT